MMKTRIISFAYILISVTCISGCKGKSVVLTDISVFPTEILLEYEGTPVSQQITVTTIPENMTDVSIKWFSGNHSVATVSPTGLVTSASVGSTNIKVLVNDQKSKIVPVTVTGSEEPKPPPEIPHVLGAREGWIRNEKNLITNFYSMYQPEVVYIKAWDDGERYPYLMWFFAWAYTLENNPSGNYPGFPGSDAIFLARAKSIEGPWEIYSQKHDTGEKFWDKTQNPYHWYPVLTCQDVWYDDYHVGDPSVIYKDGIFYMAYSAMGCDEDGIPGHLSIDTDGSSSCIMGATSTDGIHWTRSSAPLLIWEGEMGFNEKNDYANYFGGHQRPGILYEDGKWKMWYDVRFNRLGYAENEGDFMNPNHWNEIHSGKNPIMWAVDFDVVKLGDTYYGYGDPYLSWYGIIDETIKSYPDDPSRWTERQIVEYQSKDGLNWQVTGWFRPDTGYDANQIPQVFHDEKNNRVCIFYATQRGKRYTSWYDWRWDNIRMMYRYLK